MTGAIGSELSAEIEAGGRAGLEQSQMAVWLGKGLGTGRIGAATGNPASELVSGSPSFRSSWQTVINAWRGVSNGTGGVAREDQEEACTTSAVNAAVGGFTAKSGQAENSSVPAGSGVASKLTAPPHNVVLASGANQTDVSSHTSHAARRAAQDADAQAPSAPYADATSEKRPDASSRDVTDLTAEHAKHENTQQGAEGSTQAIVPVVEAPILIPASPVSVTPQTAAATPQSSSTLEQFGTAESLTAATESLAPGVSHRAATAGHDARSMQIASAPTLHSKTQGKLAHESALPSLDDPSESAANRSRTSLSSAETSNAEAQHEISKARTPAAEEGPEGQALSASMPDALTDPQRVESDSDRSAILLNYSGSVQSGTDAVESSSKQVAQRFASRAAAHGAAGETVATATPLVTAQPTSLDVASVGLRNPAAAQVSGTSVSDQAHFSTTTSAASSGHDTFSALDGGTSLGAPAWTHAGGQHAEAGFRDPALGWVGVRADLSSSGIHATLVPNSTDAAQALNGHLAGLSTHLVEQQTSVVSLSMASPGDSGIENGMGRHMQQGAQGGPQGGAAEETQASSRESRSQTSNSSEFAGPSPSGVLDSPTYTGELRGTRISVMA